MSEKEEEFDISKMDFAKILADGLANTAEEDADVPADQINETPKLETEKLNLHDTVKTSAEFVYRCWLNSRHHSLMTGGQASFRAKEESDFSAWDQYIVGEILELEESKRILHSWRTDDFPVSHPNSEVEVLFKDVEGGCEVTINHTGIPIGQKLDYLEGWQDNYFAPMKEYFKKFR